jgi:STAS domain
VLDQETGQPKKKFRSLRDNAEVERIEGCLVVKIEETMFFGNVGQLKDRLKRIEVHGDLGIHPSEDPVQVRGVEQPSSARHVLIPSRQSDSVTRSVSASESSSPQMPLPVRPRSPEPQLQGVIFEMSAVASIDGSATQTLLELVESYHARRIIVSFVKLRECCNENFARAGITDLCFFFSKLKDALYHIQRRSSLFEDEESSDTGKPPANFNYAQQPFRRIGRSEQHQDEFLDLVSDSDFDEHFHI